MRSHGLGPVMDYKKGLPNNYHDMIIMSITLMFGIMLKYFMFASTKVLQKPVTNI